MFDPKQPYNDLPLLPPPGQIESPTVLKAAIEAHRRLAELKGSGNLVPNQNILLGALTIQEAQLSSEVEGIITTTDQLFRALSIDSESVDVHTKEVLRYRDALWHGVRRMRDGRPLSTNLLIELVQTIKQNTAGIRGELGTALANEATGQVVYTPPVGEKLIRDKLANLETFIHDDRYDPLVSLAVAHYQLEAIHPFSDGNGRTGRIACILHLMQHHLLTEPILHLSRYIIQNKADYYRLLRGVTELQQWEPWILFMLEAIRSTAHDTLRHIRAIEQSMTAFGADARTAAPRAYSKDLVELLFNRPYCKIQFLIDAGIAKRQTASSYLREFADAGLLQPLSVGREVLYVNDRFMQLLRRPYVEATLTEG